ncbi:MAG: GNAT family N-acetyltransferase [Pseudomonadota bacterium]
MSLTVEPIPAETLATHLPDLARLRIAVFRDFPYLYDGDMEYEETYLARYAAAPNALVVGAWHGLRLVGAATAAPMEDHAAEFAQPFAAKGYDLTEILYCGESVLLPEYRGLGIGHVFFDAREAHGRHLNRRYSAFCGVIRPEEHPDRPPNYRPLDPFWRKRGYEQVAGLIAHFPWRDIGAGEESAKPMQFWLRALENDNGA